MEPLMFYVWSAYAVAAVAVTGIAIASVLRRRAALATLDRLSQARHAA